MANAKDAKDVAVIDPNQGILSPSEVDAAGIARLFGEGFEEQKTILLGDPLDHKIPIYFGELVGQGGDVMVETPGGKPNPETGEVPTSTLATWMFHPVSSKTFEPFKQILHTVISSFQVNSICKKVDTLLKAAGPGARAQILFRYNGTMKTRKGNQLNDFNALHRIIKPGDKATGFNADVHKGA